MNVPKGEPGGNRKTTSHRFRGNLVYIAILTHILQARVETHVLARVVTHVLVCYPMVQARVLLHVLACVVTHVLARVVTHVLARVIMHVHDYYLKTCVQG